ncbi:DUF6458 family protein [Actinomadura rudentiformis]|uniref:DUF6458 domain-containing protein n=1 Tax=Actinomadura rudentiformis TaxID=359158 RepID=A0A6H9YKW2_9ACTN|nr:DUF6458 family protein [Actinomadura rudentiformis]KAB2342402.1 hypothetical protein F8566_38270 [Actinomadura rudentiformis]
MTIGGSIALIIIGAILAYAVNYEFSGVDIRVVGIILMLGGLIGLIIGIARIATARRRVAPPPPAVREERYYEDPAYEEPPARRRRY